MTTREKTIEEHTYTSTGIKFWLHQKQMENYRTKSSNSIISTHVSPEGACNLKCPYCSVTHRKTHHRIELEVIKDYILKLKSRGLKAVILTGGGEPTAYKHFNKLVKWLKNQELSVALITNGTLTRRVEDDVWNLFSWIRVSINAFESWETKIALPVNFISDKCIVGCSTVFTKLHEKPEELDNTLEYFKKVSKVADNCRAKYIRVLPNCLLPQKELIADHNKLDNIFLKLNDSRFFHQYKIHGAPKSSICHQAYFRPYLSEVNGGTVFPCDSVVLNESIAHFNKDYELCKASEILKFLDGTIKQKFDPRERCKGCVFTDNVNMLHDWKEQGIKQSIPNIEIIHEEFV